MAKKFIKETVTHKDSTHHRTIYDEKYRILEAHFTDGAHYQFIDVPKNVFEDIKFLEMSKKNKETNIEDNDIISDYFYSELWETLSIRGRVPNRYALKKMQYFYVKVKGGKGPHGRADQKTFNNVMITEEVK